MLTLALLLGCPPPDDPSKPADPRDTGTAGCDADGDGACAPEDCDDHDPTAHPAAEEVCGDGVDNDCDGALDEGAGAFWTDADGDGWGTDPASPCPGEGLVENADDCDDADATVSPDAQEVCDGVDQDCDGAVDDGVLAPWFRDADGDGLGDPAVTTEACEAPDGWVADDTDCDDTRALASETCNELDDDCDGDVDELASDSTAWYADADGDGYGDPATETLACDVAGWVADASDCDDAAAAVHPGASETCGNGADDDCDGLATGCGPVGDLSLGVADAKLTGEAADDGAGTDLAVGDVDGDGIPDVLVGVSYEGADDAGAVYVVDGAFRGTGSLALADAKLTGDAEDEGVSRGLVADLDGDGLADVVAAGPGADAGVVYVALGAPSGTARLADVGLAFTGEADGDEAGTALAVGDVDGDGLDDLLVGARGSDRSVTDGGAVYLLAGPLDASGDLGDADAIHEGVTLTARGADWTLTLADLDGDGVDDVFLADPLSGTTGGVEVFLDAAYGGDLDLATADVTLLGVDPGERAGSALALADFDGDGALDALVGAELASPGRLATGAVYVMAGLGTGTSDLSTADATLETTDTGSSIGDVVTAGDYDGDGVADVAVGDWWGGARAGRVYLLHGPFAGALSVASADATLEGETADAAAGWALATGDLDLDGADDLVVAAYGDDVYRGAVYLVLGGPGF